MSAIKVKGTGLISTRTYVKEKHHERYNEWIKALPSDASTVYAGVIDPSGWYTVESMYYIPTRIIADMFFGGNETIAALEIGRFAADFALQGVYKAFLVDAIPGSLIKAAPRILSQYYQPVGISTSEISANSFRIKATKIYPKTETLDYRMIGWYVRSMELASCKNVKYKKLPDPDTNNFTVELSWD
ncbi:MAG: hypothetical protein H6536_08980 [Bacteroidales bacterium]|nr:hypothetical protein [Bacteroidales bacterium]